MGGIVFISYYKVIVSVSFCLSFSVSLSLSLYIPLFSGLIPLLSLSRVS